MLTLLHILSSATIHVGTVEMYCRPYAYIITGKNNKAKRPKTYAINVDTHSRWRQNKPSKLKQVVAK